MLRGLKAVATVVGGFLFAASVSAPAATAATRGACDASALPSCSSLSAAPIDARNQLGFGTPRDGGVIYNGGAYFAALDSKNPATQKAVKDSIDRLMKRDDTRVSRARSLTEKVRDQAIDYLKLKAPESPERAALIGRLNSIVIDTKTQPDETCGTGTSPGYPNAGYSPAQNTLYVCVAATNVTEAQLTQVLTHEMGHVISPCMADSKIYSVDAAQLFSAQLSQCSEDFSRFDRNGDLRGDPNETIQQLVAYNPKQTIVSPSNETMKTLAACKVLNELPKLNSPTSEMFTETKACLVNKFKASLESSDEFRVALMNGLSNGQAHAKLHTNGDDVCAANYEEAFADRFGAGLLGHIAFTKSWQARDLRIAALPMASFTCYKSDGTGGFSTKYEPAKTRVATLLSDAETGRRLACESPKSLVSCPLQFSSVAPTTGTATKKQPTRAVK